MGSAHDLLPFALLNLSLHLCNVAVLFLLWRVLKRRNGQLEKQNELLQAIRQDFGHLESQNRLLEGFVLEFEKLQESQRAVRSLLLLLYPNGEPPDRPSQEHRRAAQIIVEQTESKVRQIDSRKLRLANE